MSLDLTLRRLAATMANTESRARSARLALVIGTVDSVTPGAAADGNAAVSVTVLGSMQQAAYLASYTPVADDMVAVLLTAGAPLVLGQVIGLPDF